MKLKNNNVNFLIITTLALLLSVTFFFIINNKKADNSGKRDFVEKFTIEYLREKDFSEQSINIEKSLGKRSSFESYIISYISDGLKLYALMNIPSSKMPENGYPVVIVNHGYIPPKKYSTIDSYKLVSSYFADNGFLTLKPDYRGHDSSEEGEGIPFNRFNYTEDVINLLYATKNINKADTDNLFMLGHSMGGDITLRILEITDKVKAATLWSPVSIMFPESLLFFIRRRGTEIAKSIELVIKSIFEDEDFPKVSAIANINYIKVPIILHHGTDDESVPYEWSLQLIDKFDEAKINYKFYTYKGEDHNFTKKSFYSVLKKDVEFFKSKIE